MRNRATLDVSPPALSVASHPAQHRVAARALDLAAAVWFLLACAALFRFTAEDAFIVQRYAWQFVRGHGLVFNVGERVSALTSPLHALLLTGLTWLVPSPMGVYKILGGIAALAAILYAGWTLFPDARERLVFFSATLASPFVAMWSIGGLETPLLLACVTLITILALRAGNESPRTSSLFAICFVSALAFLLRHDSVIWVGPLALGALAKHSRRSMPGVLAATLLVGAWVVFAWIYYGAVLPASFYAKAVDTRPPLLGGIGYQLSFVVLCLFPLALFRWPRPAHLPAGAWISITLFAIVAAAIGHVHMMFGYRFYVPVLPALVAFFMRLSQPLISMRRWSFIPSLAVNACLLLIVHSCTVNPTIFHPALFEPHYGFLSRMAARGFAYEYTKVGAWAYGDFIEALRRSGQALLADAHARGIAGSARLATIIAGATPNEIPDVYVYDHLVGVRVRCPALQRSEMYAAADYVELMVPRFGPLDRLLGPLKSTAIRVSDIAFQFDGRTEHLVIYFNPSASHTPVPSRLHDPCPPGR